MPQTLPVIVHRTPLCAFLLFLLLTQYSTSLKGNCIMGATLDSVHIKGELTYRKYAKKMCYGLNDVNFQAYFKGLAQAEQVGSGTYGKVYKLAQRPTGNENDPTPAQLFLSEIYTGDKYIAVKVVTANKYEDLFMELNNSKCLETYGDINKNPLFSVVLVDYCFYNTSNRAREYFLTMKYYPYTLKDVLDGVISIPQNDSHTQMVMISLALQLEKMHKNSFLHRDIKPENILIDESGMPHFTDFGVSTTDLELANSLVGSPFYLAPEVVKEDTYGRKGDLFALGLVFHNLLNKNRKSHFKIFSNVNFKDVFDQENYGHYQPAMSKLEFPVEYNFLAELMAPEGNIESTLTDVIKQLVKMHSQSLGILQRNENEVDNPNIEDEKVQRLSHIKHKMSHQSSSMYQPIGMNLNKDLYRQSQQKIYLVV